MENSSGFNTVKKFRSQKPGASIEITDYLQIEDLPPLDQSKIAAITMPLDKEGARVVVVTEAAVYKFCFKTREEACDFIRKITT